MRPDDAPPRPPRFSPVGRGRRPEAGGRREAGLAVPGGSARPCGAAASRMAARRRRGLQARERARGHRRAGGGDGKRVWRRTDQSDRQSPSAALLGEIAGLSSVRPAPGNAPPPRSRMLPPRLCPGSSSERAGLWVSPISPRPVPGGRAAGRPCVSCGLVGPSSRLRLPGRPESWVCFCLLLESLGLTIP